MYRANFLRIGNGLAEAGIFFLQLIHFENLSAVEAFHVLGIVVFRDDLRSRVFTGGLGRFGHVSVVSASQFAGIETP
jgi:hypothetical protein